MDPAIAQSLLVASAGTLSVGSILIVLRLLSGRNGISKANGYVGGYLLAYLAVGLAVVATNPRRLVGVGHDLGPAISLFKLAVGAGFAAAALRRWRGGGGGLLSSSVAFLTNERTSPGQTFALGAAAAIVNVKNLSVFLYASFLIAASFSNRMESMSLVLLMTAVFCSTVIFPVAAIAVAPRRAEAVLDGLRRAVERHGRMLSILTLAGLGAVFLGQGLVAVMKFW